MKTVGVITFHDVPNFGAVLQAWSIVKAIQQLDCRVELINYCPPGHRLKYERKGLKSIIPSIGTWRRRQFMRDNLPLSKKLTKREEVAEYVDWKQFDCIVCGSDQIWMKDKFLGFDPTYFLDVGESWTGRKISYAPSCGDMEEFGEHEGTARILLNKFQRLSVRDKNALNILTKLGLDHISLVVDPTLLVDFDSFLKLSPGIKGDYLAVVGPMDVASEEIVRDLANRLGLKVLALGTRCKGADIEKRFVGPGQWVQHIAHARFVVTSLFHGTMFSLRFEKPFLAVGAAGRSHKIADALDRFCISDRLLNQKKNGKYCLTDKNLEMDYRECQKVLQKEIDRSKKFLSEAIHD